MVSPAVKALEGSGIPVASVATGFPSGLMPLPLRLAEIRYAVGEGAGEIDIVISRAHVFDRNWTALYDEVAAMREACGDAHMKTILATGELKTFRNVYAASMVAMQAGADFIKTSTGKEDVNATLPVSLVMLRALRDYRDATGYDIGFKPAGGIRTAKDAHQLAHSDARGIGIGRGRATTCSALAQAASSPTSNANSNIGRRAAIPPPTAMRWGSQWPQIAELMETMDYGPSPEADDAVRAWLKSPRGRLRPFH